MTTVVVAHKTAVYSVLFYACVGHLILDFHRRSGEGECPHTSTPDSVCDGPCSSIDH